MPQTAHIGISQRIEDEAERTRLKALLEHCVEVEGMHSAGGFIIRTVAEGAGEEEFLADIRFLKKLWRSLRERIDTLSAPAIIYEDLPLFLRTMRDMVRPGLEKIRIDSTVNYPRVEAFARDYIPEICERIELYKSDRPLFDLYGLETEIQTALARQLRVRNLGGIIIIDFIDMKDSEHRRQVLRTFEKAMERDYAKNSITGVSELGLVEMTRKRTRESLGHVLCVPCPVCEGRGSLKSPETVCYEIFREILREARMYDNNKLLVLASQDVVDRLLDEDSHIVADLEVQLGKTIQFQVEVMYSQEQFDVVLL
jgi:ribonuclease G